MVGITKAAKRAVRHEAIEAGKLRVVTPGKLPAAEVAEDDPDSELNAWRARQFSRETEATTTAESDDLPEDGYAAAGQVVRIGLDLVHPHPANRRPTPAAIEQLAASFADPAARQLQPILVRVPPPHWGLAEGHVQIVFGERRYRAAMLAGWESIEARIRTDLSDAEALELMAEENAKREDLNPIDRARLVESLCKSIDQGGAGLTREKAAQRVGLESGSAASNLVRLLELPDVWQQRVAAGELPESFARLLLPYCVAPGLMAAIDADYVACHTLKADNWYRRRWESRSSLEDHLPGIVREWARPIDGKTAVGCYSYKQTGTYRSEPRLFKLTDEVRQTLGVVTIPIDGKPCEVASNTKAFDKLQLPLVKAKHAPKETGSGGRGTGKSKSAATAKEPTAKQLEREREKAREERAGKIAVWRHNWLMAEIWQEIDGSSGLGWIAAQRFLCLIACGGLEMLGDDGVQNSIRAFARERGIAVPPAKRDWSPGFDASIWKLVQCFGGDTLNEVLLHAVRGFLLTPEPQTQTSLEYAHVPAAIVEDMARQVDVELDIAWRRLQEQRDEKGSRFNLFLDLWPGDTLDELGEECGLYLGHVRGRAAKLKLLLSKCPNLPLPKSIAPLAKAESEKRKAGKGTSRR
jgi:ParB/RepB/Spo0J family partition protein